MLYNREASSSIFLLTSVLSTARGKNTTFGQHNAVTRVTDRSCPVQHGLWLALTSLRCSFAIFFRVTAPILLSHILPSSHTQSYTSVSPFPIRMAIQPLNDQDPGGASEPLSVSLSVRLAKLLNMLRYISLTRILKQTKSDADGSHPSGLSASPELEDASACGPGGT